MVALANVRTRTQLAWEAARQDWLGAAGSRTAARPTRRSPRSAFSGTAAASAGIQLSAHRFSY
jgi:hypothetical protein